MASEEKEKLLKKLESDVANDGELPLRGSNLVFGEGSADAEVIFAGEAPGFHEDRLGRPFVGQAGKLLDKLLKEIDWKREGVYITNIVKRRPPQNRDPLPDEVAAYAPYLIRQLEIISPKIIVPLGRFAAAHFVPDIKISRDEGKLYLWREYLVVPLYHPAAALRSTAVLEDLRISFQKLPEIVRKYDKYKKERESREGEPEKPNQGVLF